MIYVERCETPAALLKTSKTKVSEDKQAREHFEDSKKIGESFNFKVYKDDSVQRALRKMFGRYCAYCESDYACAGPMDVEHFRPKGGFLIHDANAAPALKKPGYWWLAACWDNLLASCPGCNRVWEQDVRLLEDLTEVEKAGKGNWFPLENEAKRATKEGDEALEEPLLINPCVDFPEDHLHFRPNGLVIPTTRRGYASVLTYGLHRDDLTRTRADHAVKVQLAIRCLKHDVKDYLQGEGSLKAVDDSLSALYRTAQGPYKALTRAMTGEVNDLIAQCETMIMLLA